MKHLYHAIDREASAAQVLEAFAVLLSDRSLDEYDPALPLTGVIDLEEISRGAYAVWLNDGTEHEVKVFGKESALCVTHAPGFCIAAARTCFELARRRAN